MIKKIGVIVCVLSVLLLLGGCKEKEAKIYGDFNNTQEIVLYDNDISFIGDKDKALNLDEIPFVSQNYLSINEVHCVTEEKVYFSYSYFLNEKKFWGLSSVNWDGTELETIYENEFTVSTMPYHTVIDKDFSYRNGFFVNNKIVLNENGKVVEYDINTGTINVYTDNYTFPTMGYYAAVSSDKKSVAINFNNNMKKIVEVDYIAENLIKKDPEKCSLYYFQMCEEKLYLYVLYNQESIIQSRLYLYEYDFKKDSFEYVFSRYFVYDEYELYVVPKVITNQQSGQNQSEDGKGK